MEYNFHLAQIFNIYLMNRLQIIVCKLFDLKFHLTFIMAIFSEEISLRFHKMHFIISNEALPCTFTIYDM